MGNGNVHRVRSNHIYLMLLLLSMLASLWIVRSALYPRLPYWFWRTAYKPLPAWGLLIPLVILQLGCVMLIAKRALKPQMLLIVLVFMGVALQQGFALMEGRGIRGMRDRLLNTGHTPFAVEAARQDNMLKVAREYLPMIKSGKLPSYPHATKPPGQLLFYMATEKISGLLPGAGPTRLDRLANLASLLWPLLCSLTLIPLYFLSRLFFDGPQAFIPSVLYIGLPSITLITLHLDQCLYPLLFVTATCLAFYGLRQKRLALLFFAGMTTSAALFVSFSLAVLIPFIGLVIAFHTFKEHTSKKTFRPILINAVRQGMTYLAGFLVFQSLLFLLFRFNGVEHYRYAMSIHQGFKIHDWTLKLMAYIGCIDLLEFAIWCGGAIAFLVVVHALQAIQKIRTPDEVTGDFSFPFFILLFALAFLAMTVAETARLWLFITPMMALCAAAGLQSLFKKKLWPAVGFVAMLQIINTFGIKMWQDFF